MKRHLPGVYTEGSYAIVRSCDCSGHCESRWVQRDVLRWIDGEPVEFGVWGLSANSKRELVALIAEVNAR